MACSEKINFNIPASTKKDIERLASYHGKTLSAFMLEVCDILVKNNSEKIKEQAEREKEPINFISTVQSDSKIGGEDNG